MTSIVPKLERPKPIPMPPQVPASGNLLGLTRRIFRIAEKTLGPKELNAVPIMSATSGGLSTFMGVYSIYMGMHRIRNAYNANHHKVYNYWGVKDTLGSQDNSGYLIDGAFTLLAGVANTGSGVNTILTNSSVSSLLGITGAGVKAVLSASAMYAGLVGFGISVVNAIAGLVESYMFRSEMNRILECKGMSEHERRGEIFEWLKKQVEDEGSQNRLRRVIGDNKTDLILEHKDSMLSNATSPFAASYDAIGAILNQLDKANHEKNTQRVLTIVAAILGIIATTLTMTGIGAAITVPTLLICVAVIRLAADFSITSSAISKVTFQNNWENKIKAFSAEITSESDMVEDLPSPDIYDPKMNAKLSQSTGFHSSLRDYLLPVSDPNVDFEDDENDTSNASIPARAPNKKPSQPACGDWRWVQEISKKKEQMMFAQH